MTFNPFYRYYAYRRTPHVLHTHTHAHSNKHVHGQPQHADATRNPLPLYPRRNPLPPYPRLSRYQSLSPDFLGV